MAPPLFKPGDHVRVQDDASANPAERLLNRLAERSLTGVFEVVAVMPLDDKGRRQYRIRGGEPAHERVVVETQLIHAPKPQPRG